MALRLEVSFLSLLSLTTVATCSATDEREDRLDCADVARDWYDDLVSAAGSRVCVNDSECVLAPNDVSCEDPDGGTMLHFGGCGLGVVTTRTSQYDVAREELKRELCARGLTCTFTSLCSPQFMAYCKDGECRERPPVVRRP